MKCKLSTKWKYNKAKGQMNKKKTFIAHVTDERLVFIIQKNSKLKKKEKLKIRISKVTKIHLTEEIKTNKMFKRCPTSLINQEVKILFP